MFQRYLVVQLAVHGAEGSLHSRHTLCRRRPQAGPRRMPTPLAAAVWALLCVSSGAMAQESQEKVLPRVDVIGNSLNAMTLPGSAAVIDAATLEESRVFTVNEALRKVPGVHVREEEGVGLRPNIGIRGLNPTRSTKTLLLEDGLPLSYAPYGDNASYYHPPIDRYDSIEVSKGSQVLRFGPQTAGGVINYLTPEPQKSLGGFIGLAGGTRGYLNAHFMATGNGAIVDVYRKQADGARDHVNSTINDLNFKWAGDLNADNKLILRATHYDEKSNNTYAGLTEQEFRQQGARYNPFKNDHLDFRRTGLSATHQLNLGSGRVLTTSVYGAYFDRDWWRQASSSTDCVSSVNRNSGQRFTDSQLNDCDVAGRIRHYTTTGIESRMSFSHGLFGMANRAEVGAKFHNEIQRRWQRNYDSYATYASNGALLSETENQRRSTQALSMFASNQFSVTDQLAVTPIVRVENIRNERLSYLSGGGLGKDSLTEIIPGIGAVYSASAGTVVYGGLHKGFSPPRVEDMINNNGGTVDLSPERSINMELGVRTSPTRDSFIDVAVFRNDFSNNVQVGSIAGGNTRYSEGKALYQGLELAGQLDKLTTQVAGNLFMRIALTYLPTAEQKSAFRRPAGHASGEGVENDYTGRRLPYAPEHQATVTLGYKSPDNWNTRLEYVYVGKQFADFANTATVDLSGDGRTGPINAYGIWNATVNYTIGKANLFVAAKNLTDQIYTVDRTRGILVGMPRTVQMGIKYAF